MRILSVGQGSPEADIANGRNTLRAEIQHPSKCVMVVRGTGPGVARFADSADGRAAVFPHRVVVWVQDERILDGEFNGLFRGNTGACAVVLDLNDRPAVHLTETASLYQIDKAFRTAEGG